MAQQPPYQITSWQEAERNAERWMRHWGFSDALLTSSGTDGGVDVRGRAAVAQVKFEASQVGRPALQRLYGARGARHDQWMLFFTGAGYSAQALEYADSVGMALFLYRLDGQVTAVNRAARQLVSAAAERDRARAEQQSTSAAGQAPAGLFDRMAKAFGADESQPGDRPAPRARAARGPVTGAGAACGAIVCLFGAMGAFGGEQPLPYRLLAGLVWLAMAALFLRRLLQVKKAYGQLGRQHLRYALMLVAGTGITALGAATIGEPGALQAFLVCGALLLFGGGLELHLTRVRRAAEAQRDPAGSGATSADDVA